MLRSSTQQAFIEAPVERVWQLVGDPNRHPDWWPEMVEVECADLEEGCRYRGVVRGPFGTAPHDLVVDRFEDCREVSIYCDGTGVTTRFVLAEAQGGTFVEGSFTIELLADGFHDELLQVSVHALMAGDVARQPEAGSGTRVRPLSVTSRTCPLLAAHPLSRGKQ